MWKTPLLKLLILLTATVLWGCDNGNSDTALTCEELERTDYSESVDVTPEQRRGVDDYLAMGGRYNAIYECMDIAPVDVVVEISNISPMNIELYLFPESQDVACEEHGITSFEMTVENSGDPDLDEHDFYMSGGFPVNENPDAEDWAIHSVSAQSDAFASAQTGIAQYRIQLHVDYSGELAGAKNVITEPMTLSSGAVSTTQRDECILRDFVPIAVP